MIQGTGDPNTYDFYLFGIQTQIPSGYGPNTVSVSGTIDFTLSQPTLAYLDGLYTGNNSAGYSFSDSALPWSTPEPEMGVAPSDYTLLPAGQYELSVNDSNASRAGTGTHGSNIADIAFYLVIPEPTTLIITLPLLAGYMSRRRR